MKNPINEISQEQTKRILVKGIVAIAFEGCIKGIDMEIKKEKIAKNTTCIKGLTRAKNIINELKTILKTHSQ